MSDVDPHYSTALDALYFHREAAALDAMAVREMLHYHSMPAGLRRGLTEMLARLEAAARGDLSGYRRGEIAANGKAALEQAGAAQTLTRSQWETSAWNVLTGKPEEQ